MLKYLQYNKLFVAFFAFVFSLHITAQNDFPFNKGDRTRYAVQIDFTKAYISGVCIMLNDGEIIKASVVNEFGVSALDFTYNMTNRKVKILNVMGKMNKWYIKKVLKKDLKQVMFRLQLGEYTYEDAKYKIKYTFELINETQDKFIHNCKD